MNSRNFHFSFPRFTKTIYFKNVSTFCLYSLKHFGIIQSINKGSYKSHKSKNESLSHLVCITPHHHHPPKKKRARKTHNLCGSYWPPPPAPTTPHAPIPHPHATPPNLSALCLQNSWNIVFGLVSVEGSGAPGGEQMRTICAPTPTPNFIVLCFGGWLESWINSS